MGKRSASMDADGLDPIETSPSRRTRSRHRDIASDDDDTSSSSASLEEDDGSRLMRAVRVEGHGGRANQLLVSMTPHATANVVYFPGDVQNFEHRMRKGRFKAWTAYSYEATAAVLAAKYPTATIWIVQPHRIEANGVSSFDNFVPRRDPLDPMTYSPQGHAIEHLRLLMEHACACIDNAAYLRPDLQLHLLGFSRGVAVVNQMVTELALTTQRPMDDHVPPTLLPFFKQVVSIHWIDGGNGSGAGAFPSHSLALSVLGDLPSLKLHLHWTPYQFASDLRPWIAHEGVAFCRNMEGRGLHPIVHQYFANTGGSLEDHFKVLVAMQVDTPP
ncbi:hypothetical protein ACHHYP_07720 [Achlya hypogyna]|uniref:Uncharacterized protein n=1 Tax=Achlya hypogyna TaxID=1202772 RepID=A0A1V9YQT4_ACHHY|nr:hypothetical protein ACHHYP_07720 [Achlya hypogyna]